MKARLYNWLVGMSVEAYGKKRWRLAVTLDTLAMRLVGMKF